MILLDYFLGTHVVNLQLVFNFLVIGVVIHVSKACNLISILYEHSTIIESLKWIII